MGNGANQAPSTLLHTLALSLKTTVHAWYSTSGSHLATSGPEEEEKGYCLVEVATLQTPLSTSPLPPAHHSFQGMVLRAKSRQEYGALFMRWVSHSA